MTHSPNFKPVMQILEENWNCFASNLSSLNSEKTRLNSEVENQNITRKVADETIALLTQKMQKRAQNGIALCDFAEKSVLTELNKSRELHSTKADENDLFLLKNCYLEEKEVLSMLERHKTDENRTMVRILKKYCRDNNLKIKLSHFSDETDGFTEKTERFKVIINYHRKGYGDWKNRTKARVIEMSYRENKKMDEKLPKIDMAFYRLNIQKSL